MRRAHLALLALLAGCADRSNLVRLVDTSCPAGSHFDGSGCVSDDLVCGAGTHLSGIECLADSLVTCGSGTYQSGYTCLPLGAATCGAGTHLAGNQCLPDSGLTCGTGTHLSGTTCLPDPGITCGPGTHASAGTCLPDPPLTCGPGTHLAGSSCLPDLTVTCAAGTHLDAGRCVLDASTVFELRTAASTIPADGYSKIPVLVLGRNADGSPSQASLVLWTSRPGAGAFTPVQVTLGPLGAIAFFTPCSSASVGCTGGVELRASLATDPTTPVAASGPLTLAAPAGVGSSAPCLLGGNVMFFDGNDYIFNGTMTVTSGTFSAGGSEQVVSVQVTPGQQGQGTGWMLDFSASQLGQPLATQVYTGAMRYPFEQPGVPGLSLSGDGRGCSVLTGRFEIEELVRSAGRLSRFTATFEQHCEGGSSALRGCIHLEQ
jgi:hypothetical protein